MFGWFRQKKFMVSGGYGPDVDLLPIAKEVLKIAPEPCGMDAKRLAELAQRSYAGMYIKVGEYPEGIDRAYAQLVIRKVVRWASGRYRQNQLEENDLKEVYIVAGEQACDTMLAIDGSTAAQIGIFNLPHSDCWQGQCTCGYRVKSHRNRRPPAVPSP